MREDGAAAAACESIAETGAAHYEKAAEKERIAEAMRAEFVEANLHMLMVDCRAHPSTVIPCVAAAGSAAQIEEQCLSPLDEAGDVEGKYFSRK